MPLAEFESEIPASQRLQTQALERAATRIVNNSIQFNGYLLTCRLNSTSVYCIVSTKTQIKHKNSTSTQKDNTKQTKQEHGRKKQYQRSKKYKPTKCVFPKLIFNFFMPSTCFEPEDSSSGRWLYIQLRYGTFYIHQEKQSSGRRVLNPEKNRKFAITMSGISAESVLKKHWVS